MRNAIRYEKLCRDYLLHCRGHLQLDEGTCCELQPQLWSACTKHKLKGHRVARELQQLTCDAGTGCHITSSDELLGNESVQSRHHLVDIMLEVAEDGTEDEVNANVKSIFKNN